MLVPAAVRLGLELRGLRMRRGMSQRALVRALGLSAHSNLVQYELGRRIPPGDIVAACERLFGEAAGPLRELWVEALAERADSARTEPGVRHPATVRPAPAMLPANVADFTGRRTELAELAALATELEPALLLTVVTGTAGVGKTALAVHFAHRVRDRFPDGQLYLNLHGYGPMPPREPVQALAALLFALGLPAEDIPSDVEQAAALYRSQLAGQRMLVLLDNAHRADQVRPLLPGTPGSLVLVTSRDRLGGLTARDGARRLRLGALGPADARELMARIVGPVRIAAEPEAAAELARRCAFLPLALRIAATHLADQPDLRLAAYTATLRDGAALATLTVPGDEQGVVSSAFTSSYERLSPGARRLFRLLAAVPGPDLTVGAAAALLGERSEQPARPLDELVAAHLLDQPAAGRFACHDLLREYAAARAESGEREAAAVRLYDWYARQVDSAATLLYPDLLRLPTVDSAPADPVEDALAWLEAERPNLVAAVVRAAAHGPYPAAWRLADGLRGYFYMRLHATDWLTVAEAGRAAARADGHLHAEAAAELSLAYLALYQGRYPLAIRHGTRALTLARDAGWRHGEAATMDCLGTAHWQTGELTRAAEHYERALSVNRETGRLIGQANNLGNLGLVYRESGQLARAVDHFRRALTLDQKAGSRFGEATTLSNLGEAQHALGRLDQAAAYLRQSLVICRDLGDRAGEADALHTLAAVDLDAGRTRNAHARAEAAVALAVEISDQRVEADARNVLATVYRRGGDPSAAADNHRRALVLARACGNRAQETTALIGLATDHVERHHPRRGIACARRALRLARASGHRVLEGQALAALASGFHALGRPAAAIEHARLAWAVHRATGYRLGVNRRSHSPSSALSPSRSLSTDSSADTSET